MIQREDLSQQIKEGVEFHPRILENLKKFASPHDREGKPIYEDGKLVYPPYFRKDHERRQCDPRAFLEARRNTILRELYDLGLVEVIVRRESGAVSEGELQYYALALTPLGIEVLQSTVANQDVDPGLVTKISEELFKSLTQTLASWPTPKASYRLQFTSELTLQRAADEVLPYLDELGVDTIYCSPLFQAVPDSSHGYNIIDCTRIDKSRGGEEGLEAFLSKAKKLEMRMILDNVPNHWAAHKENPWWWATLRDGPECEEAIFFDISWQPEGKVVVPVLGAKLVEVCQANQLEIELSNESEGKRSEFILKYYEHEFPLSVQSWTRILVRCNGPSLSSKSLKRLKQLVQECAKLEKSTNFMSDAVKVREALSQWINESEETVAFARAAARYSSNPATILALLPLQHYRLEYWRHAHDQVNYRRFFDINELVALNMHKPEVFAVSHALLARLLQTGQIVGVRIDHLDGLEKPREYLDALHELFGIALCEKAYSTRSSKPISFEVIEPEIRRQWAALKKQDSELCRKVLVLCEKILSPKEITPGEWPIAGTTGYSPMDVFNRVFIDPKGLEKAIEYYRWHTPEDPSDIHEMVAEIKDELIKNTFKTGLAKVTRLFSQALTEGEEIFDENDLRAVIIAYACNLEIYRTYAAEAAPSDIHKGYIESAISKAGNSLKNGHQFLALDHLKNLLFSPEKTEAESEFLIALEQLTSPLEAKAFEDTLFYRYLPLISLNEVGSGPNRFVGSVEEFHVANKVRREYSPREMVAGSTHDTKRGEDARIRINCITQYFEEWCALLREIGNTHGGSDFAPSWTEQYLLFQTLIGTPFHLQAEAPEIYAQRITGYMEKAIREAKLNTSWTKQNVEWEEGIRQYVTRVLRDVDIVGELRKFNDLIDRAAFNDSLARLVIQLTAPGFPDVYQGSEWANYSLVDPDNRRPVDFEARIESLRKIKELYKGNPSALHQSLVSEMNLNHSKQYILWKILEFRNSHSELFLNGNYKPISPIDSKNDQILAFAREEGDKTAIVVTRRFTSRKDTEVSYEICLEIEAEGNNTSGKLTVLRNIFTGEEIIPTLQDGKWIFNANELLRDFPVAVLESTSISIPVV